MMMTTITRHHRRRLVGDDGGEDDDQKQVEGGKNGRDEKWERERERETVEVCWWPENVLCD